MQEFEIYFTDLTKEAQERFLRAEGLKDSREGNYDIFPIATVCIEEG